MPVRFGHMSAIHEAVQAAGSQAELARRLGVRQQSVQEWVRRERIPAERVLSVESATGIPRHRLRPDLYPRDSAA